MFVENEGLTPTSKAGP